MRLPQTKTLTVTFTKGEKQCQTKYHTTFLLVRERAHRKSQ